ncbi:MAG: thioredoxin [Okeania sp. SIO3B3]|nr:thioredoxin [Okeania sp. SIO3B3]
MAIKKQFNSFDELLANSEMPVLVDFYATWCGHYLSILKSSLNHFNQRF